MEDNIKKLLERQQYLYNEYSERLKKIIAFIEIEFKGHPIPVLGDIRDFHDLTAACFEEEIGTEAGWANTQELLAYAESTYTYAIAECYHYSFYEYGKRVLKRYKWAKYLGNLESVSDGDFYDEYKSLCKLADTKSREGDKYYEAKNYANSYLPYREALECMQKLDRLFDDHLRKINRSMWKGVLSKTGWAIIAIVLLVIAIIKIFG